MSRITLFFIILCVTFTASSKELVPVSSLLEQSKDPAKLRLASTALVRCAALIDLTQVIALEQIDEKLLKDPTNLLKGAVNIRLNVDGVDREANDFTIQRDFTFGA